MKGLHCPGTWQKPSEGDDRGGEKGSRSVRLVGEVSLDVCRTSAFEKKIKAADELENAVTNAQRSEVECQLIGAVAASGRCSFYGAGGGDRAGDVQLGKHTIYESKECNTCLLK